MTIQQYIFTRKQVIYNYGFSHLNFYIFNNNNLSKNITGFRGLTPVDTFL